MKSFRITRVAVLPPLAAVLALTLLPLSATGAPGNTVPASPTVTTGGVSHVSGASAVLQGTVNPHTFATTYYFQYGPTVAYGMQTTTATLPAGTSSVKVQQTVVGLEAGDHYRLVANNADGTVPGADRIYTAQASPVKSAFELPKTYAAIPVGGTFILSGALTGIGNADRAIVLQSTPYPYSTPFTDVGSPILTTSTGRFSFEVAKLSRNTRFRVATVGTVPLYSAVVPQEVSVRVTMKVRSSRDVGLVRLYGTVSPAEVGARVYFELERIPKSESISKEDDGVTKLESTGKGGNSAEEKEKGPTFVSVATTVVKPGTRALSRFSAVVSIRDTGSYRAVVVPSSGLLAAGHSLTVMLHAPAGAKKKRTT